jgi:hypothetical protein
MSEHTDFGVKTTSIVKRYFCKADNYTCGKRRVNISLGYCGNHAKFYGVKDENEGTIRIAKNGRRQKMVNGQWRYLCKGDNDKCKKLSKEKHVLCDGHISGIQKFSTKGYKKGDIKINETTGVRKIFNGIQWCIMCNYESSLGKCNSVVVNGGKCKTHSTAWRCKFTKYACEHIRIEGDYCRLHRENTQHPKQKSVGETLIAEILDKYEVDYKCNDIYRYKDGDDIKYLYIDFYLPFESVSIEFDGTPHFMECDRFAGEVGLLDRHTADIKKNKYCLENFNILLRIPYTRKNDLLKIIQILLNNYYLFEPGLYVPYEDDKILYQSFMDTTTWKSLDKTMSDMQIENEKDITIDNRSTINLPIMDDKPIEHIVIADYNTNDKLKKKHNKLCKGKDGACTKLAHTGGLCRSCGKTEEVVKKYDMKEIKEAEKNGEPVIIGGNVTIKSANGRRRNKCTGQNGACQHIAKKDGLCLSCSSGNTPHVGKFEGDNTEVNGVILKAGKTQNRRECSHVNEEGTKCSRASQSGGLCCVHMLGNKCQYLDEDGNRICNSYKKSGTQYCTTHGNAIANNN